MVSFVLMKYLRFPIKRSLMQHHTCTVLQQHGFKVLHSQCTFNDRNYSGIFLNQSRKLSGKLQDSEEKNSKLPVNPYSPGKKFVQIYKFPYITHAQVLCRMKILQTILTVTVIPGLYYVFGPASSSPGQLAVAVGLGGFACFMLGIMGEIFRKFIGIIYYNPDEKQVCIAHLTFWGNRCNSYYHVDDIVPFGDRESNLNDIYLKLRFYSKPSLSYWITLRHGLVVHQDHFYEVFQCLPPKKEH